jgi:hypothetical protein
VVGEAEPAAPPPELIPEPVPETPPAAMADPVVSDAVAPVSDTMASDESNEPVSAAVKTTEPPPDPPGENQENINTEKL